MRLTYRGCPAAPVPIGQLVDNHLAEYFADGTHSQLIQSGYDRLIDF